MYAEFHMTTAAANQHSLLRAVSEALRVAEVCIEVCLLHKFLEYFFLRACKKETSTSRLSRPRPRGPQ